MPLPEPNTTVAPDLGTLSRHIAVQDQRILNLEAEAQRQATKWQRTFDEQNARYALQREESERLEAGRVVLQQTLAQCRDTGRRQGQRITELEADAARLNASLAELNQAYASQHDRHAAEAARIERIEREDAVLRQTIRDFQDILEHVGSQIVRGQTLIERVAKLDVNHATA